VVGQYYKYAEARRHAFNVRFGEPAFMTAASRSYKQQ